MASKPTVNLIGMGMGNPQTLTRAAWAALEASELVIGSPRLLEALDGLPAERRALVRTSDIAAALHQTAARQVSVVMSGDVGFYSGATPLCELLGDLDVEVIPGISSLSYLCARLRMPWHDAAVVSVHGREADVAGTVQSHAKTFVLTGGAHTPGMLCEQLVERGLGAVRVHVGERLSYPDERIVSGTATELAGIPFDPLAAMLVENPRPLSRDPGTPHLSDTAFVRGRVPMSKEEVRGLALCKLRVRATDTVWDVGAGTGSIGIEAARLAFAGRVFAIERSPEACALIEQNRAAFGLTNLSVVAGMAPEVLDGLPTPDCVFVGGSSGQLTAILRASIAANPAVRLCVSAITLETLSELTTAIGTLGLTDVDICQVSIAKTRLVGGYRLMQAQNPVYLASMRGPAVGEAATRVPGGDGTARHVPSSGAADGSAQEACSASEVGAPGHTQQDATSASACTSQDTPHASGRTPEAGRAS